MTSLHWFLGRSTALTGIRSLAALDLFSYGRLPLLSVVAAIGLTFDTKDLLLIVLLKRSIFPLENRYRLLLPGGTIDTVRHAREAERPRKPSLPWLQRVCRAAHRSACLPFDRLLAKKVTDQMIQCAYWSSRYTRLYSKSLSIQSTCVMAIRLQQ